MLGWTLSLPKNFLATFVVFFIGLFRDDLFYSLCFFAFFALSRLDFYLAQKSDTLFYWSLFAALVHLYTNILGVARKTRSCAFSG